MVFNFLLLFLFLEVCACGYAYVYICCFNDYRMGFMAAQQQKDNLPVLFCVMKNCVCMT